MKKGNSKVAKTSKTAKKAASKKACSCESVYYTVEGCKSRWTIAAEGSRCALLENGAKVGDYSRSRDAIRAITKKGEAFVTVYGMKFALSSRV